MKEEKKGGGKIVVFSSTLATKLGTAGLFAQLQSHRCVLSSSEDISAHRIPGSQLRLIYASSSETCSRSPELPEHPCAWGSIFVVLIYCSPGCGEGDNSSPTPAFAASPTCHLLLTAADNLSQAPDGVSALRWAMWPAAVYGKGLIFLLQPGRTRP